MLSIKAPTAIANRTRLPIANSEIAISTKEAATANSFELGSPNAPCPISEISRTATAPQRVARAANARRAHSLVDRPERADRSRRVPPRRRSAADARRSSRRSAERATRKTGRRARRRPTSRDRNESAAPDRAAGRTRPNEATTDTAKRLTTAATANTSGRKVASMNTPQAAISKVIGAMRLKKFGEAAIGRKSDRKAQQIEARAERPTARASRRCRWSGAASSTASVPTGSPRCTIQPAIVRQPSGSTLTLCQPGPSHSLGQPQRAPCDQQHQGAIGEAPAEALQRRRAPAVRPAADRRSAPRSCRDWTRRRADRDRRRPTWRTSAASAEPAPTRPGTRARSKPAAAKAPTGRHWRRPAEPPRSARSAASAPQAQSPTDGRSPGSEPTRRLSQWA